MRAGHRRLGNEIHSREHREVPPLALPRDNPARERGVFDAEPRCGGMKASRAEIAIIARNIGVYSAIRAKGWQHRVK